MLSVQYSGRLPRVSWVGWLRRATTDRVMRSTLVPLSLLLVAAGCAREAAPPATPLGAAQPVGTPAAPVAMNTAPRWGVPFTQRAPAPWSSTAASGQPAALPRLAAAPAPPRTNLVAAPAPSEPAGLAETEPAPLPPDELADPEPSPPAPDTSGAHSVQPPASEIAALKRMLRQSPPPRIAQRSSARIPAGSACLEMLDSFHLPYTRLEHVKGIKTPVSVRVPIGGIRYHSWGKRPLVADCRFVVALEWIAPVLKQIGVSEVRYIGTYSYRMARVGRLSLHAYGLAIDIEGFVADGKLYKVSEDFKRGMGKAGCSSAAPVLDQIGCRVKEMRLFREVLTPDSNADHAGHFHFGVLPLGITLAMLPRYLPGHRHHQHHKHHATKLADETAPKNDDVPQTQKLAKSEDKNNLAEHAHERRQRHCRKADKHCEKVRTHSATAGRHLATAGKHSSKPGKHAAGEHLATAGKHSSKPGKHAKRNHKRLAKVRKPSSLQHRSHESRHEHSANPHGHSRHHAKALAKRSHSRSQHSSKRVVKTESHRKHSATHSHHSTGSSARSGHTAKPTPRLAGKRRHAAHHHAKRPAAAPKRTAKRAEKRHHAARDTAEKHHRRSAKHASAKHASTKHASTKHASAPRHPRTAERHHHRHGRPRKSDRH